MPESLSRRLAELEGAESALMLASGRAAVACTVLALLRPGDHLLACAALRASTRHFFAQELPALGVEVSYVDPRDTRGWRRALRRTSRALYVESPVVSSGRIMDLKPPRTLAQELGIAFIVDATAASPVNFTPIAHGVDVVLHDATYFLDPHGDGEAGVVAGTEGLVEEVRLKMETWGAVPHPMACAQMERALATLDVRAQRQNATAQTVADWAERQSAVAEVQWAGSLSHPDRAFVEEWFRGPGSLLLLRLDDAHAAPLAAARAANLLEDSAAGHHVVTRVDASSEVGWLRIQVGLESAEVIVAALRAALAVAPLSTS